MNEIRLIDKTFRELEIDGVGYFALPRKVYSTIEELQQENKHNKYILTEFEKWLEERIKISSTDDTYVNGMHFIGQNHSVYNGCLDKL